MVGEIYHIYNIQITEKYICENSPLSWHDLIIILPFRTLPITHKFAKNVCPSWKAFFGKMWPPYFSGGETPWIAYASKTKESTTSQKLGSRDF